MAEAACIAKDQNWRPENKKFVRGDFIDIRDDGFDWGPRMVEFFDIVWISGYTAAEVKASGFHHRAYHPSGCLYGDVRPTRGCFMYDDHCMLDTATSGNCYEGSVFLLSSGTGV